MASEQRTEPHGLDWDRISARRVPAKVCMRVRLRQVPPVTAERVTAGICADDPVRSVS